MFRSCVLRLVLLTWIACLFQTGGQAQTASPAATGTLRGNVTLEEGGAGLHKAFVLIVELSRSTESGEDGAYEFTRVPPGTYSVVVHVPALADSRQSVTIAAGQAVTLDFSMRLAPIREQIVVTASGREETAFDSFQSVTALESIELTRKAHTAIGEVLESEPGVAKRSFGAGNGRPVLRGFDGDRVLIMQDGLGTGSLSSQSGDHGESLNALNLERIEVVRGPATLLYGSNAIGGVVNAITGHHQIFESPHKGLSGYLTAIGGSANAQGGGGVGMDYGWKKWLLTLGGGGQRTGDYDTPAGEIANSRTRSADARGGLGWFNGRAFSTLSYDYDNRRFGIPFAVFLENGPPFDPDAEVINLRQRRHDIKFSGGMRNLTASVESFRVALGYVHYRHGEFDGDALGTDFSNKQFNYRVTFDQRRWGRLSGSFGFSGMHRDYKTTGDEALAPPVRQNSFALFTLQTVDLERVALQLGGRFEHSSYDVGVLPGSMPLGDRSFNGFSGAAGLRLSLWPGGALVANYTHSFRAPALEELYNNGPHPGNIAFEIGNPALQNETGNGIDLSLRHHSERFHVEGNFFFYSLQDFVFLTPTGNVQDGLPEAEFLQSNARYKGGEFRVDGQLAPGVWFFGGMDIVRAELSRGLLSPSTGLLTSGGTPLPRIPPLRGRAGLDLRWTGLSVRPEGVFVSEQNRIFPTETPTGGYALFNLSASYTITGQHVIHVFSVSSFNLTNRLYRNHLSLIKDLAPELGRGVRFAYTMRFF